MVFVFPSLSTELTCLNSKTVFRPSRMNAAFSCSCRFMHILQPTPYKTPFLSSSPCSPNPGRLPPSSPVKVKIESEETVSYLSEKLVSRRLILLRHAESSWKDLSMRDHDRPLSKDGRDDAVEVSHKLQKLGWIPQLILSSDAKRTRETLKIMQEQVRGFLEAEVHFISSFYSIAAMDGQTAVHLQRAIINYSREEILTVMCMGHNRGWEEAASMFVGHAIELKTCNAALLEAAGKSWDEAFSSAGLGGWKLQGLVKPDSG